MEFSKEHAKVTDILSEGLSAKIYLPCMHAKLRQKVLRASM